ncbi:MAG: hypothetical protein MUC42_11265 [Bryobacter sp.]|nr:hypothetical protein [Bryobacter sp.]
MEPKPPTSRLAQHQSEALESQSKTAPQAALEFATPEELIRHDASQTVPPPALTERVKESLAAEPPPAPAPWWKRWLGR